MHAADDATGAKVSERATAAEDKIQQLGASLKAAEHRLTTELADDKKAFMDAVEGEMSDFKVFFDDLSPKAGTQAGAAKKQLDSTLTNLRSSRNKLAERSAPARKQEQVDARCWPTPASSPGWKGGTPMGKYRAGRDPALAARPVFTKVRIVVSSTLQCGDWPHRLACYAAVARAAAK